MAMRRALVVSNAAGTREVVTDGREGLVFPVGDIDAFAGAVSRLAEHAQLRHALVNRAYDRVATAFSTRASARRLGEELLATMARHLDGGGAGANRPAALAPAPPRLGWADASPSAGSRLADGGGR
jgi:hypothetical protein